MPFGAKSIGEVWLKCNFGLNQQDSEKISLCVCGDILSPQKTTCSNYSSKYS